MQGANCAYIVSASASPTLMNNAIITGQEAKDKKDEQSVASRILLKDLKYYLNVTENGSCRINFSNTEKSIVGLSLMNLTTGTGIVIIGDKGMSVVHDEGFLQIESIIAEFSFVGNVIQWFIVYNSKYYSKKEDLAFLQNEMQPLIQRFKYDENNLFSATNTGKIAVARDNLHKVDTNPAEKINLLEPKDPCLRKTIRRLNNLCGSCLRENGTSQTHRVVPVDIQFNGNEQTNPPQLVCSYEQVKTFVQSIVYSWDEKELSREYSGYLSMVCTDQKSSSSKTFPNNEEKLLALLATPAQLSNGELVDLFLEDETRFSPISTVDVPMSVSSSGSPQAAILGASMSSLLSNGSGSSNRATIKPVVTPTTVEIALATMLLSSRVTSIISTGGATATVGITPSASTQSIPLAVLKPK